MIVSARLQYLSLQPRGQVLRSGSAPTQELCYRRLESTEPPPQMLTEVRAFYGGVEMAIAVAMILLWKRGHLFASLLVGGLPLLGSASGRCIGLLIDGFSSMHLGFAILELVGAAFCLAGCIMATSAPETTNVETAKVETTDAETR
ncbi:DUF4345 family protein [Rubripirellula sp.]|nr:DUF4345 family protein [Rubripirellula sp.]